MTTLTYNIGYDITRGNTPSSEAMFGLVGVWSETALEIQ